MFSFKIIIYIRDSHSNNCIYIKIDRYRYRYMYIYILYIYIDRYRYRYRETEGDYFPWFFTQFTHNPLSGSMGCR